MKKLKNLYILLVAAAVVWGLIAWRIVGYHSNEKPETSYIISQQKIGINAEDSIVLLLNYPDPFLGNKEALPQQKTRALITKGTTTTAQHSVERLNFQIQRQENAPAKQIKDKLNQTIAFKGLVKNSNNSKQLGILVIDGKELLIKQGDFVAGWQVVFLTMNKVALDNGTTVREIEKR